MILESILVVLFALIIDFKLGDDRNRFHPTILIGGMVERLVPLTKNCLPKIQKIWGIILVIFVTSVVSFLLFLLQVGIDSIPVSPLILFLVSVGIGAPLLKTTIAIRSMETHAKAVIDAVEKNDLDTARTKLAMIVKRNTKNLDKNHILSGTIESVGENTVDGITGPLFYFAFFGLPGSFVYRAINTIDSMIGYKTTFFKHIGWFGANCDKILNYLPARITGLVMILSAIILRIDWKSSYQIMRRDGLKPESPNSGYPMAAMAGALGTQFEKINHYTIGDGDLEFTMTHITSAIKMMKVTSILFSCIFTIPVIVTLSYLGWWIHA